MRVQNNESLAMRQGGRCGEQLLMAVEAGIMGGGPRSAPTMDGAITLSAVMLVAVYLLKQLLALLFVPYRVDIKALWGRCWPAPATD